MCVTVTYSLLSGVFLHTTDRVACSTFRDSRENCAQWTENRPSVRKINIKLNNAINEVLKRGFSEEPVREGIMNMRERVPFG